MSSHPNIYESARPRKRRAYPYRLPLGAFCCILIWFFAIFMDNDSEGENLGSSVVLAELPQTDASNTPFRIYDFQEDTRSIHELHQEVSNAVHYYGLVVRNSNKEVPEAQILLPENYPYKSFQELVQTSRSEGLRLMVGKERQVILQK
jgi:hypothetical protein